MSLCCVLGLGYIGLPTSILLSSTGHKVVGVDINKNVVEKINKGILHIKEPNLNKDLIKEIKKGNLTASEVPVKAEIYIIAVPTPFFLKEDP